MRWMLALVCAMGAQAAEYQIAGTVVNSLTGQPIRGVQLVISGQAGLARTVSSAEGKFTFTGLPAGQYKLTGQRRGYLEQTYGLQPPAPTVIVAGEGQDTAHLIFQFAPPAIITGKVVDEEGEPVEHATVELLATKVRGGKRRASQFAVETTNDIGEYRFSVVPPGVYYMAVSGYPWFSKMNEIVPDAPANSPVRTGYAVKYYPDVADPASAEPLRVRAGVEITANFSMLPAAAVSVNVDCSGSAMGNKDYKLTAAGVSGSRVVVRQGSEAGDAFTLWSVPSGHYQFQTELVEGNPKLYARTTIDVGTNDMDVSVELRPAPVLTGNAEVEGGSLPESWSAVLYDDDAGRTVSALNGGGGRFSFPGIAPGRYRVGFNGPDDYYLKSWSASGGARTAGDFVELTEGSKAHLTIVVAKGAARMEGKVYREQQPVAGAMVVLVPAAGAKTGDVRGYAADSDGSYHFAGLALGDYSIFAVEDTDLEYGNPAALTPYMASAKKVRVTRGGVHTERVEVTPVGGRAAAEAHQ